MRLGIVASRFNEEIAGELLERARAEARKLGVEATVLAASPARSRFRSRCNGWRRAAATTRWSRSAR